MKTVRPHANMGNGLVEYVRCSPGSLAVPLKGGRGYDDPGHKRGTQAALVATNLTCSMKPSGQAYRELTG